LKSGFEKRQYFKRFRRAFQKKRGWDQAKIFGTMLAFVWVASASIGNSAKAIKAAGKTGNGQTRQATSLRSSLSVFVIFTQICYSCM